MRYKKRKLKNDSLFSDNLEPEETALESLQHKAKKAKKLHIDFGFSQLLSKEGAEKLTVQAILKNEVDSIKYEDIKENMPFWLNFACAAGSEKSVLYILEEMDLSEKIKEATMPTALCYAAASGNQSLCQKLLEDYASFCHVDQDVLNYATLSGDKHFLNSMFETSKEGFIK